MDMNLNNSRNDEKSHSYFRFVSVHKSYMGIIMHGEKQRPRPNITLIITNSVTMIAIIIKDIPNIINMTIKPYLIQNRCDGLVVRPVRP